MKSVKRKGTKVRTPRGEVAEHLKRLKGCVVENEQSAPAGSLTVEAVENRKPEHKHCVYLTITLRDERGQLWQHQTSAFRFELNPSPDERPT
jgi:hypothetical protein